ncbi:hypothetical protein CRE_21535 [Caenorhabditis remanei]|uniref:Uncharacterized protein n=1 Tax=Caenorhabditis remanei TaxID=31234 RepID=E3NCQ5_CAERE|nr:hypothetical protein CRE_21535 [Caenorhabditis remanei]
MAAPTPTVPDDEFPFHLLSFSGQRYIIGAMTNSQLLQYSLISESTKKFAKNLKREATFIALAVYCHRLNFPPDVIDKNEIRLNFEFPSLDYYVPPGISFTVLSINEYQVLCTLENEDYSWKDYICHISEVFNCKSIKLYFGRGVFCHFFDGFDEFLDGFEVTELG